MPVAGMAPFHVKIPLRIHALSELACYDGTHPHTTRGASCDAQHRHTNPPTVEHHSERVTANPLSRSEDVAVQPSGKARATNQQSTSPATEATAPPRVHPVVRTALQWGANLKLLRRPRSIHPVVHLVVSLCVAIAITYVSAAGIGPLPPLGPALNPDTGVWTLAADAQLPATSARYLSGLDKSVKVSFEPNGTAHIAAATDHDMFLAMGYVHATFRLFQMDMMRRQGAGLLSEVVGPDALPSDEFEYQLGLMRTAQAQWAQMQSNDPARQALLAYTQGVNAVITQQKQSGHLPVMFKLLGYEPAPWTPIDSLIIQGVMTQTLSFSFSPLDYALLVKSLGYDRTMQWFPIIANNEQHPYDPGPYQPASEAVPLPAPPTISTADVTAAVALLAKFHALPGNATHHFSNSNGWVVDGTMTASGKPIMAGDPHLLQTLPAIWYQLESQSPHYQLAGVSIPGLPAVLLGRNAHISWTITNTQNQSTFFYVEKTDTAHRDQYFWNGAWHPIQHLHYRIPVKGGSPEDFTVALTVHGPIMTQAGQTVAVWWSGALPSADLHAQLGVMRASNFQQFHDALRDWGAPTQNFLYADDQGHIGQISAGIFPLVKSGQPWLPLSGTGDSDVIGKIPFDAVPQVYDPPTHFTFSANQREVDGTYPYYIGTAYDNFDLGFRADMIYHTLSTAHHLTVADMQKLQNDTHDYLAEVIVPQLNAALSQGQLTSQQAQAATLLRSWDYDMNINSAAANIWNRFWKQYLYEVYHPWWMYYHVPENQDPDELQFGPNSGSFAADVLVEDLQALTLNDPTNPVFSLPGGPARDASGAMRLAFEHAVSSLGEKLGTNPQDWTWGKVHFREIPSLTQIPALGYGPFPSNGNVRTVNVAVGGGGSVGTAGVAAGGASWRFIIDWATGSAIAVYPGGESENPLSPWYKNQIPLWWHGEYYPMVYGDRVKSLAGVHTWTLQP